jgi:hypothetical protein
MVELTIFIVNAGSRFFTEFAESMACRGAVKSSRGHRARTKSLGRGSVELQELVSEAIDDKDCRVGEL